MPIRKLPLLLINQIAAGEVIERPASVVKELVENSLDAGSRRIDVVIEDGGRELIRVSDDGCGIAADELPLAIAPHATSKIAHPDDLAAIGTFGFRGEALASMASVSRLRITSRATIDGATSEAGATLEASGDSVGQVQPIGCAPGTTIEVRDLFFNTPARRKFLRGGPTEFGHIADLIARVAMAHPAVAFSLTHGGRKTLEVAATNSRRRRCVEVLGKELDEALLEFEHAMLPPLLPGAGASESDLPGARVWGLAGLPSIARATSKFQYLYVNSRPIRDRNLTHALRESYRGLAPMDRQPVAVVFIEIDPHWVDVNVHPAKLEVRFRDSQRMHGLVLSAMRQRLLGQDLTPTATLPGAGLGSGHGIAPPTAGGSSSFHSPAAPPVSPVSPVSPVPPVWPAFSGAAAGSSGALTTTSEGAGSGAGATSAYISESGVSSFVDYFRRMDPRQKGFVYQQVREAVAKENPAALTADDDAARQAALGQSPSPGDQPAVTPMPAPLRAQSVLQVHKSYLVTQDNDGLLIVDQHALHERIMFEELQRRIGGGNLESQRLLMPAIVRASARRQALLEPLRPLLERIGIEIEPIGPEALAVQAFPSFLFDRKVDPVEFINELLDQAEEGDLAFNHANAREAALHRVLDMMACKAAVKAGDAMSAGELETLLARREEVERASNCPHGRPTAIRLSLRDLEKQFKRT